MRANIAALLCLLAAACRDQLPAADVVARVNGEPISKQAFENAVSARLKRYGEQRSALPEGVVARLQEAALQALIAERVVAQQAEALGVAVDDAELAQKLAEHRGRFRSQENFVDYLARANTTEEALRAELRQALLRDRLVDKLGGPEGVDDAEVRRYYEENAEQFAEPEVLRAHRLFVAYPRHASAGERRRVRAKMARLRERAVRHQAEPQAFAELCAEASEGAEASRNGDLGPLAAGRLPELDRAVAQGLAPGELTEVLEVAGGLALFRLDAHVPRRRRPLAEVQAGIRTALLVHRRNDHRQEAMRALRNQARVETFVSFVPTPGGTGAGPAGKSAPAQPLRRHPAPPAAVAPADVG